MKPISDRRITRPARQPNLTHPTKATQIAIKHSLDRLIAAALLVLMSPLLAASAVAVKVTSRGPIFFRQPRLGFEGQIFRVWKFRTMVDGAARLGPGMRTMASDPRITPVGRVMRRTRIDELPQVLNILVGEMSLVGPRPTLPYQYDYYEEWEKRRLRMRPGMTGWSQTHGGNGVSWDERIAMDVWFVDNWSLWLDVRVIAATISELAGNAIGSRSTYSADAAWTRGPADDPYVHHGDAGPPFRAVTGTEAD